MTGLLKTAIAKKTPSSPEPRRGKAANLVILRAAGFQVPEFVISPDNILAAVERLGTPLAVRSSARGEDGAAASFAGQFRSFLNLRSVEEVEEAVRLCHESLHQPSVHEYCGKNGIAPAALHMDVILQRMIEPELAGVAFTVNPVSGVEEVVIEGCRGLADDMLAGREKPLPENHPLIETYRPLIDDTARRIQRYFGAPQDIEFAIEAGMLFVLQSRPITRIGCSGQRGAWTNADFRDGGVSSSVCTPLMWSLYELVWDYSLKQTLRDLRLFRGDFSASRIFFGRPYWNLGEVKECLAVLPGFKEREFDQDLSVQINYQGDGRTTPLTPLRLIRTLPKIWAVRKFLRSQQQAAEALLNAPVEKALQKYQTIDGSDPAAFRDLVEREYFQVETIYFRTIFAASLAKLQFIHSFPEADYGSLVAALPPLRHVEPVREVQAMPQRTSEQLSDVIDRYRHHYRSGLDVIFPRWDEDHVFVQKMLAELPASGGNDPRPAYEAARNAMLRSLPRWKHPAFQRTLVRLRHFLWLREELRDVSNRVYHCIRRCALALAEQRDLGDSVFFQTYQAILRDDRSQVEAERERYESYRNFSAPNEIGCGYQSDQAPQRGEMRGIAASPGVISAKAFVARNVEEATAMPRDGILVCPYTDPGWTVVLDRAAGVVTETGGLLSHAAIICREYGIPAVLSVPQATRRITQGSQLVLDGSQGRVDLLPLTE